MPFPTSSRTCCKNYKRWAGLSHSLPTRLDLSVNSEALLVLGPAVPLRYRLLQELSLYTSLPHLWTITHLLPKSSLIRL